MTEEASWHRKAKPSGPVSRPPPRCTLLETTLHILPHTNTPTNTHTRTHCVLHTVSCRPTPPLPSPTRRTARVRAGVVRGRYKREGAPPRRSVADHTAFPTQHFLSPDAAWLSLPSPPLCQACLQPLCASTFFLGSSGFYRHEGKESGRPAPQTATQDARVCPLICCCCVIR